MTGTVISQNIELSSWDILYNLISYKVNVIRKVIVLGYVSVC
jgi:hypothetical protein